MKTIFVVLLFLLPCYQVAKNTNSTTNKLQSVLEVNEGDIFCIIIMNVGECDKCYNNAMILNSMLIDSVKSTKLKSVLAVNVERKKDLLAIAKKNKDFKHLIHKSDEIKKEYNLNALDSFLMIDCNGKELYRVNSTQLEKNFNYELQKLTKISKKYLKLK